MNIMEVKRTDAINGRGVHSSVWVAGCRHHCRGCFSEHTWAFDRGEHWSKWKNTLESIARIQETDGISILGGDPLAGLFATPLDTGILDMIALLRQQTLPEKPLWLWTGYTYEELLDSPWGAKALGCIDVLIEGRYVQALRDLSLRYRGSSNQRVLPLSPLGEKSLGR